MKDQSKNDVEKQFEKRLMSELFRTYADYMTDVETDKEWDEVEKIFKSYHMFIKMPK